MPLIARFCRHLFHYLRFGPREEKLVKAIGSGKTFGGEGKK